MPSSSKSIGKAESVSAAEISHARQHLATSSRIVVKVGTRVLVDRRGRPKPAAFCQLVQAISALHKQGKEILLVSSGAIGAGLDAIGLSKRPIQLPLLQMAAAVGQVELLHLYRRLFAKRKITIGQVLLTHADLSDRDRHINAQSTISEMLKRRVIPIINENDVVSIDEIKFSDNDHLAALTAMLTDADLLILLSTVNGLRAPTKAGNRTQRVGYLPEVTQRALSFAWNKKDTLSSGGIATKLQAAQSFVEIGGHVIIADGRKPDTLPRIFKGDSIGTLIGRLSDTSVSSVGSSRRMISNRRRWIAFFQPSSGRVIVDDGAAEAIVKKSGSLLAAGVRKIKGPFEKGAIVDILTTSRVMIARGKIACTSAELHAYRAERSGIDPKSNSLTCIIRRENLFVFAV